MESSTIYIPRRMVFGRERLGKLLKAPFQRNHSRRNTPARTPDTTLFSNVTAGCSDRATVSSRNLAGLAHDPQPLAIAVPLEYEAFQKAILECLDNLSDDDKAAFRSAKDVMEKLGELQQGKCRTHTTCTQKVQKVQKYVRQFLTSVAICIQHHPEISSLVVGGLNCILTISFY